MGLYERLLEEKRILEETDTEEDKERRRRLGRMSAYVESRRRSVPAEGYVTSDELREQEQKPMEELRQLESFMLRGPSGFASALAFGHLRRKYRTEYLQLCGIQGRWAEHSLATCAGEHSQGTSTEEIGSSADRGGA